MNEQLPISIKDRSELHGIIANNYMHKVSPEAYQLYGDQLAAFGLPLNFNLLAQR